MKDESGLGNELTLLSSNIKKHVYGVLDFFLSFLTKYEEKKMHNMISLMLDPKNLCIISSFVGKDHVKVSIVSEYDKKSLYRMLVKCHEYLDPFVISSVD
jgi:RNA-binding protein YlmH